MAVRFVSPREHVEAYVDMELFASSTYVDFVYGSGDVARRVHRRLVEADVGEFASPNGWLAVDERRAPVGMVAGPLGPKSLAKARLASALALLKDVDFTGDPEFRARAAAARPAFLAPQEGDAYLSRIAVAPAARRRGIGGALLDRFFQQARALGATRAVLEVSPLYVEAVAMYRAAGFESVGGGEAQVGRRALRYLHLARSLASHASKPPGPA